MTVWRRSSGFTPWIDGHPFFERIERAFAEAKRTAWVAVSFIQPDFLFPSGATFWEVLDRAHRRGVDVRVLFWRNPDFALQAHLFNGSKEDRALLSAQNARWSARWDLSPNPGHCHHQKFFVFDQSVAFVGGMVLSNSTVDTWAHQRPGSKHDAFLEVQGTLALDVAAHFVTRWREHRADPLAPPWPDPHAPDLPQLVAPPDEDVRSAPRGRLLRTLPKAHYASFPQGAEEIREAYVQMIDRAKRTIYIENQHPGEASVLEALTRALERGVLVTYVLPLHPMTAVYAERQKVQDYLATGRSGPTPRYLETFETLSAMKAHPGFTLAGLMGEAQPIYVHAKLCLVDDHRGMIGSANLVDLSLRADHTELNVEFEAPETVHALLRQLAEEHLERALEPLDDRALHQRLQSAARNKAARSGRLVALDPARYPAPSGV